MTQVQLAAEAGVTEIAIQNYEANKRIPNALIILRIARALNTDVEELYEEKATEEK